MLAPLADVATNHHEKLEAAVEEALAIIDRDIPHKLDADVHGALEVYAGRSNASADPVGMTVSEA